MFLCRAVSATSRTSECHKSLLSMGPGFDYVNEAKYMYWRMTQILHDKAIVE